MPISLPTSGNQISFNGQQKMLSSSPILSAPVTGGRAIAIPQQGFGRQNVTGAQDFRGAQADAVLQTDEIPISSWAASGIQTFDFGWIAYFLDHSGTRLAYGQIEMIDSNGVPHDLANFTLTKSELNGFTFDLPPGRYRFKNVSGGSLTKTIVVHHVGSRNLL